MNIREKYNNIYELIEENTRAMLKKYYSDKPIHYIGFSKTKGNEDKITLKYLWTYAIFKNSLKTILKHWREYFRNWRSKNGSKLSTWKEMSVEDKEFFGYNLNNIDYEKMESLNLDEFKFIVENLLNVSRESVIYLDNLHVNFGWLTFTKKIKKIRNKKLIENRLLINTLLKVYNQDVEEWVITKNDYKEKYKEIREKQVLLKEWFQAWVVDKIREEQKNRDETIEIPDISDIKPNEEMDVNISKNIFKQL